MVVVLDGGLDAFGTADSENTFVVHMYVIISVTTTTDVCSVISASHADGKTQPVSAMVEQQSGLYIPSELIPKCPICGKPMTMNLRSDDTFVEDAGWHKAAAAYSDFIRRHENLHVLYLELGVGSNTPMIIKYPFWNMTDANEKAVYACLNYGEAYCPKQIEKRAICINGDIGETINSIEEQSHF